MMSKKFRSFRLILTTTILSVLFFTLYSAFADNVTTSASVTNSVPVASNVELNGILDITLTANETSIIQGDVTITDNNGCQQITSVNATLYRTDILGGSGAGDDNRSHYSVVCQSNADCSGATDTTDTYTCEFNMSWYADPTDSGTYDYTNWTLNVTPSDGMGGTSGTAQQEVNSLMSLSIDSSAISFGSLQLGTNTTTDNENTTAINTGNMELDINILGYGSAMDDLYCMVCDTGEIDVYYFEFDSMPFNYGEGTPLSEDNQTIDLNLDRGSEGDTTPSSKVYYGLGLPTSGLGGNCTGTVVLMAEESI